MSDVGLQRGLGRGHEAIRNQNRHQEPDFGHLGSFEANEGVRAAPARGAKKKALTPSFLPGRLEAN